MEPRALAADAVAYGVWKRCFNLPRSYSTPAFPLLVCAGAFSFGGNKKDHGRRALNVGGLVQYFMYQESAKEI
jgi:hypothetical protein